MIKRTLLGIACVLLALSLGAGGEWYLRDSAVKLLAAAEVPESASDEALFNAAEAAVSVWNSRETLLGAVIKHSDADELAKLFSQLKYYADIGDAEECAEKLMECETEVRVLLKGERFAWENILHINVKIFLKSFTFITI